MTPAEQRFEGLVVAHGSRVLAYQARGTTPVEEAADVYQETLTTAWRKVHDCPDDLEHVHDALAALGHDREVLTLTYWDGLTSDQMATVLGVRPATARKRLERARRRVTAALAAGEHPASADGKPSEVTVQAMV